MEPNPEYFTFENSTLETLVSASGNAAEFARYSNDALKNFERALQNAGPNLEIMCDALLLCLKIFNRLVLPRLAALESRLPLEMLPQPVRWDGIP